MSEERDLLLVRVKGLALDGVNKSPIVLLHPEGSEEVMPIWIGRSEASAIAIPLSGASFDRPLTHDLVKLILDGLDIQHVRTEITHLEEDVFYARLLLRADKDFISVDCRPSDGVAIAMRSQAEIYVNRQLFESQKQIIRTQDEEPPKEDD